MCKKFLLGGGLRVESAGRKYGGRLPPRRIERERRAVHAIFWSCARAGVGSPPWGLGPGAFAGQASPRHVELPFTADARRYSCQKPRMRGRYKSDPCRNREYPARRS